MFKCWLVISTSAKVKSNVSFNSIGGVHGTVATETPACIGPGRKIAVVCVLIVAMFTPVILPQQSACL